MKLSDIMIFASIFGVFISVTVFGIVYTAPAAAKNNAYSETLIVDRSQEFRQNIITDIGTCTFISDPSLVK